MTEVRVSDVAGLRQAITERATAIEVVGIISGSPSITLPPGTTLRGGVLRFGGRGVRVTTGNTLRDRRTGGQQRPGLDRPMGTLTVHGDLATAGGTGTSLVKGVQTELSAIALSVKPGGSIESLRVDGDIRTRGDGFPAVELDGPVGEVTLGGTVIGPVVGSALDSGTPDGDPRFSR
ncbi:hypothetical protein [Nonomuraea longicatena]|uniref:Uncharacterized protein n=1 Tax=Nonomuraea longicatena TaxID=83682 RepID=A0ABP4B024_9ACTN